MERAPRYKRSLALGLVASVGIHAAAAWLLHLSEPETGHAQEPAAVIMDFDIHEAPAPPEAEMPVDTPERPPEAPPEESQTAEPEETTGVADDRVPVPDEPIVPEPEPDPDPDELLARTEWDAGVPDAGAVAAADRDAGVFDAGMDAGAAVAANERDAGVPDGGLLATTDIQDGGLADDASALVASAELDTSGLDSLMSSSALDPAGPAQDAPEDADATGEPGTGAAITDGIAEASQGPGGREHSPSQANLLAYLPEGEVITLLLRFDRLRGTEWADQAEAVLAPMPDYRSLVGNRQISSSQLFDALVISSPSPREVTATTLVGHSTMAGERLRSFLDHPGARVSWRPARGGSLGIRSPSRTIAPHDERVFLMPRDSWVVLTQPAKLGKAAEPVAEIPDDTSAALPAWLSAIHTIEREAGRESGPAVVVTVARLLPPDWEVPYMNETLPTPESVTLALEVTDKGFFVRGTMLFPNAQRATRFVEAMERVQRDFVATRVGKMVLSQVQAYNAMRGLTLARNRSMVGFATSISVADARAAMYFAAQQTRRFFLGPAIAPAAEP